MAPEGAVISPAGAARATVAAIVTNCTRKKFIAASKTLRAASLAPGRLPTVAEDWRGRLAKASPSAAAADLYRGRSFTGACRLAKNLEARLFIVSAGLGLVAADTRVPAYGLTISKGSSESLGARLSEPLDDAAWFAEISQGPFAAPWSDLFERPGLVLIALTQPYIRLTAQAMLDLPTSHRERLRLFGASLERSLPAPLHNALMPYDARLDWLAAGVASEFPQRAMADFVGHILVSLPTAKPSEHARAVAERLAHLPQPVRPIRMRLTNAEIERRVRSEGLERLGAAKALRELRARGFACEYDRFMQLFKTIRETRAA